MPRSCVCAPAGVVRTQWMCGAAPLGMQPPDLAPLHAMMGPTPLLPHTFSHLHHTCVITHATLSVCGATLQVFFIRDGMQFPDLVHCLRPNPKNNIQEAWRILDFLSFHPESVNIVRLDGMPCLVACYAIGLVACHARQQL